jgi:hypothetical protein
VASDLVDYGCENATSRVDFLLEQTAPRGVSFILSNPPYKNADAFVTHALRLVPRVVFLLPLSFLESEKRCGILDCGQLAKIYPFRNRLPRMHQHGWTGRRVSNPYPYAWFAWDRDHRGPPVVQRISWKPG